MSCFSNTELRWFLTQDNIISQVADTSMSPITARFNVIVQESLGRGNESSLACRLIVDWSDRYSICMQAPTRLCLFFLPYIFICELFRLSRLYSSSPQLFFLSHSHTQMHHHQVTRLCLLELLWLPRWKTHNGESVESEPRYACGAQR